VDRESKDATKALEFAIAVVKAGHLIGIYPEGTLTRDESGWPMVAKTGIARLAILTQTPVIPVAAWGPQKILPTYGKVPHLFPRTKVSYHAGPAIDLSRWYGKADDQQALIEATALIMRTITLMLEKIRGEVAPALPFDPHTSDLPRIGNFKNAKRGKK
jgi:1-acyl-sn-glycerol-3-phosphate acyltransferase